MASVWSGKLFSPRGLTGLQKLIHSEIRFVGNNEWTLSNDVIGNIRDLQTLSRLRIPQSVWVPLVSTDSVKSITEFEDALEDLNGWRHQGMNLPVLLSHGARVSVSKDSLLGKLGKQVELQNTIQSHFATSSEVSVRIDACNNLSIQMNTIPPRPWIQLPRESGEVLNPSGESSKSSGSQEWWSVIPDIGRPRNHSSNTDMGRVSEESIKLFRNESSLSCLCASMLRAADMRRKLSQSEPLVVWDPFASRLGSVLLELIQLIRDECAGSQSARPDITFIANVNSEECMRELIKRLNRYIERDRMDVLEADVQSSGTAVDSTIKARGGRKSRSPSQDHYTISGSPPATDRLKSISIRVTSGTVVHIHITTQPFQEVLPHMRSAVILTHVPKSYSEQTGIDKRQMSQWTAFGDLLRREKSRFEIFAFTETHAFFTYSRLKFAKLVHLVSPGGHVTGSISKWTGY